MSTYGGTTPTPSDPPPPLTGDWPAQAADAVVNLVGVVRDRTIAPLLTVVRALVYGMVIMLVAIMAIALVLIALVRLLDIALPGEVWSAYLLLGVVMTAAGFFLWSRRKLATA